MNGLYSIQIDNPEPLELFQLYTDDLRGDNQNDPAHPSTSQHVPTVVGINHDGPWQTNQNGRHGRIVLLMFSKYPKSDAHTSISTSYAVNRFIWGHIQNYPTSPNHVPTVGTCWDLSDWHPDQAKSIENQKCVSEDFRKIIWKNQVCAQIPATVPHRMDFLKIPRV